MSININDPKELTLWPWQEDAVEALRENIRKGIKNQILAAPTGSGKTYTSAYLIKEALAKGSRVAFCVDRISLVDQTSAVFDEYGISHGVIQGDHWRWAPHRRCQIASAQTLARRKWPEVDLIVIDEAHTVHKSVAERIKKRDVVTIGLTATPFTRGLGKLYDGVVNVRTLNQLTDDGYLAPFRAYSASEPDMEGAKVSAGEWTLKEASDRSIPIVGDLVQEYLKHAHGKQFIAFGSDVAHCEAIQKQFMAAGVQTGLYTYKTHDEERAEMLREFKRKDGYLTGLVSVAALSKGFDHVGVECIIMARPLRSSFAEHIQILGRGLRRDPENPDKECIVLDHAGNMARFWAQMVDYFENGAHELDDGKRHDKKKREEEEPRVKKCPACKHVHSPRPACPICGHTYPVRPAIEHVPGELKALAAGTPANVPALRQDVYSQLLHYAEERGYKKGFAAHKYRELFSAWPDGLRDEPKPATRKTLNWIKSRQIAWAKGRAKAEAQAAS